MPINLYKSQTMLAAIEQMAPATTFLRDRYFETAPEDIFPTDDVLVEYRDLTNKKLAPVVMPRKGSITVERDGYVTSRMSPALVAPSRVLTIDDLNKKGFGESLFSDRTPAQRQAEILRRDLIELDQMIANREEAIAACCMFENGYVLKQYSDEYGSDHYKEYEIRFYEGAANPAVYVPGVKWNAAGSDKLADLHCMIRMLTTAGNDATDVLLGDDAANTLLMDSKIKELLDLQHFNIGAINPVQLTDGAALLGVLNVRGRNINLITYDGTYEDEATGDILPYVPNKSICVTAPGAGRALYGAVTQVEQEDGEPHTYASRRVPKTLVDAGDNTRKLVVSSRPLLAPKKKNPFIAAQVID